MLLTPVRLLGAGVRRRSKRLVASRTPPLSALHPRCHHCLARSHRRGDVSDVAARYGAIIVAARYSSRAIFVAEIAIRMLACWPRPRRSSATAGTCSTLSSSPRRCCRGRRVRYGRPSGAPVAGHVAGVRVSGAAADLGTTVRSIPSMGHVIVLLSLLLYVYAVLGFHFFREADSAHWGSLGRLC